MGKVDFERIQTINSQKDRITDLEFNERTLRRAIAQARSDILRLVPEGPARDEAIARLDKEVALCQ